LNELHDWIADNDFHNIAENNKTTAIHLKTISGKLEEYNEWLNTVDSNEPHIMETVKNLHTLLQIQIDEYGKLSEAVRDHNDDIDSKDISIQTSMEYVPVPNTVSRATDNICISQTITDDGKETICISNIPNLQPLNEDHPSKKVIIQAIYKPGDITGRHTEICLSNIPKTFETRIIEPDLTQTDISVDDMGNKTVTVKKLTQSVQYSLQSNETIVEDSPVNVELVKDAIIYQQELSQDAQQVHIDNKVAPVVDNIGVVDNTSLIIPKLIDEVIDETTNVQIAECIKEQEHELLENVDDMKIWPQRFDSPGEVYTMKPVICMNISEPLKYNNEQHIWPVNSKTGFTSPENYCYDFDVTVGQSDEENLDPDFKKKPFKAEEDERSIYFTKDQPYESSEKLDIIEKSNISGKFSIILQVDPNEINKVEFNILEKEEESYAGEEYSKNIEKLTEIQKEVSKSNIPDHTDDKTIFTGVSSNAEDISQTLHTKILKEKSCEISAEPKNELGTSESIDFIYESMAGITPGTLESDSLIDDPKSSAIANISIRPECSKLRNTDSSIDTSVQNSARCDNIQSMTDGASKLVAEIFDNPQMISDFPTDEMDIQNIELEKDAELEVSVDNVIEIPIECEVTNDILTDSEIKQKYSDEPQLSKPTTPELQSMEVSKKTNTESSESMNKSDGNKKSKKLKIKKKHHRTTKAQTSDDTDGEATIEKLMKQPELDIKDEQVYTLSSDDTYQSLSEIVEDIIKVIEFSGTEAIDDVEGEMHSQIILPIAVIEGVETADEVQQTEEPFSHSEAPTTPQSNVLTDSKDIQTITVESKEIGAQTIIHEQISQDVQTMIVEYCEVEMQTNIMEEPIEQYIPEALQKSGIIDHDTQTDVETTKDGEIQMRIDPESEHVAIKPQNLYCTEDIINPLILNLIGKVVDLSFESQHNTEQPKIVGAMQSEIIETGTKSVSREYQNLGTQTISTSEVFSNQKINSQMITSVPQFQSEEANFEICEVDVITELKLIPPKTDGTNAKVQYLKTAQRLDLSEPVSLSDREIRDLTINVSVVEDDISETVEEPLSMPSELSDVSARSHSSIVDRTLNFAAINHAYQNLSKLETQSSLEECINRWICFIIKLENPEEKSSEIKEFEAGLKDILSEVQKKAQEIEYKIESTNNSRSNLDFDADIEKLLLIRNELNDYKLKTIQKIYQEIMPKLSISDRLKQLFDSATEKYLQLERSLAVCIIDLKNRKMRWSTIHSNILEIKSIAEVTNIKANKAIASDLPLEEKLDELDILELQMNPQITKLILVLKAIKQFSTEVGYHVEVPNDFHLVYERSKILQNNINLEKNRIISFLGLTDEYEQTLEEFSNILRVASNLIESHLTVASLEQLQEEVQKHRKFFININHCRSILESLESNLDVRTKTKNKTKHNICYTKATDILERASERFQKLALATSKLTTLEKDMKTETQWLMVAQQRLPDLSSVSSADFEQFITFYLSFSKDTAAHYSKLLKINDDANRLQNLVSSEFIVKSSQKLLLDILQLREETTLFLNKLQGFSEIWNLYNRHIDKLESWMLQTERQLALINVPSDLTKEPVEKMREFWEIRAQYEVYNVVYQETCCFFDEALKFLNISDDALQRQYNSQFCERWRSMSEYIVIIQKKITDGVTDALIPTDEKLQMLRDELLELKQSLVVANKEVLKSQNELRFHIERLEMFKYRVTFLGSELGKIGLLSSVDSNTITELFAITRSLSLEVEEDLELANLMQDRLHTINVGINQVEKSQTRLNEHLNECKETVNHENSSIEKALGDLYAVQNDLSQQWTEIMHLRQLLHTLPVHTTHKFFVSPVQMERLLAAIQDEHASLEKKYELVYALLRERLSEWKRFEQQIEIINQYINETEYMIDILTVHDHMDLKRLSQATDRLQDLQNDFSGRQVVVDDLKELAQPLIANSVVEISKNLQNTIEQTINNWTSTKNKVSNLSDKYQRAITLWRQYHECASVVDSWLEKANEKLEDIVSRDDYHIQIRVSSFKFYLGQYQKLCLLYKIRTKKKTTISYY
jgi:hypothetical protein